MHVLEGNCNPFFFVCAEEAAIFLNQDKEYMHAAKAWFWEVNGRSIFCLCWWYAKQKTEYSNPSRRATDMCIYLSYFTNCDLKARTKFLNATPVGLQL
jgi:hypothetical protein